MKEITYYHYIVGKKSSSRILSEEPWPLQYVSIVYLVDFICGFWVGFFFRRQWDIVCTLPYSQSDWQKTFGLFASDPLKERGGNMFWSAFPCAHLKQFI